MPPLATSGFACGLAKNGHAEGMGTGSRFVSLWLFAVAAAAALTLMSGGLTRLMGAGLAITEWLPVRGVLLPLTQSAWEEQFARYQLLPQFRLVNPDMTLASFKIIYWWEWGHRMMARLTGALFVLPLLWLAWRRLLPRRSFWLLGGIFLLGAAQAVMGWLMVQSGLEERIAVAPVRLAAHLMLGALLFASCVGAGIRFWPAPMLMELPLAPPRPLGLEVAAWLMLVAILAQAGLGALTAGMQAGHVAADWPLMGGRWIPERLFVYTPPWRNFVENPIFVQFAHRITAYGLLLLALWQWRRDPGALTFWMLAALLAQAVLGVMLLRLGVPLPWAALHQAWLLLLVLLAVWRVLDNPARRA